MMFNTKNVQVDAEKIQQQIQVDYTALNNFNDSKDLKDLKDLSNLKEGHDNKTYLVKATFPLALFRIEKRVEKQEADNNSSIKNILDFGDKLIEFSESVLNKELRSGILDTGYSYGINCSYAVHNQVYEVSTKSKAVLQVDLTDTRIYCEFSGKMPRYVTRVVELATEIRDKYFGSDWKLTLTSNKDIKFMLSDIEFFEKLDEALVGIRDRLAKNIVLAPVLKCVAFEDVLALNIIKIVKKGTDREENLYTGNCKSIVFEALVNGVHDNHKGIQLLKSMVESDTVIKKKDGKAVEIDNFSYSNIITTDAVSNIKCTRYIIADLDTENNLQEDIGDNTGSDIEYTKYGIGCGYGESYDEIVDLFIPAGMELSNSFKAKYI